MMKSLEHRLKIVHIAVKGPQFGPLFYRLLPDTDFRCGCRLVGCGTVGRMQQQPKAS